MQGVKRKVVSTVIGLGLALLPSAVTSTDYDYWWYDQSEEPIVVPARFLDHVSDVVWCESKDDPAAIGSEGELGRLQIHPIHFAKMRSNGFNPNVERDRNIFAITYIWMSSGWSQWSCKP